MIVLATQTVESVDITELVAVSEHIVSESAYLAMIVEFSNISGDSGAYRAQVYVNDKLLCPDKSVTVNEGLTSFRIQSKSVLVIAGSILVVKVQGLTSDVSCDINVTIVDVTPIEATEMTNVILPEIVQTVADSVDNINIVVKQQTKLLGPCENVKESILLPKKQGVVTPLLPTRATASKLHGKQ